MSRPQRTIDLPEVVWRKSTRSGDTGGSCVEVAEVFGGLAVRDSKDPEGPVLHFERDVWGAFVQGLRSRSLS